MDDFNKKIKALEFLQQIIMRMSNYSHSILNWFVLVFGGFITFILDKGQDLPNLSCFIGGLFIILGFYLSHVQYLKIERIYRLKYLEVVKSKNYDETYLFDLDVSKFVGKKNFIKNYFWSCSYIIYAIAFILLIAICISKKCLQ